MANFQHALHQVEIKTEHAWHSGKFASDQFFFHGAVHPIDRKNRFRPVGGGKRFRRHVDGLQCGFNGIS